MLAVYQNNRKIFISQVQASILVNFTRIMVLQSQVVIFPGVLGSYIRYFSTANPQALPDKPSATVQSHCSVISQS